MGPTITEPATQEPGVTTTQPEEQPATAVTTPVTEPTSTQPQTTDPVDEPANADNSQAEELSDPASFWQKKGIDISTPEGLAKATKSYQEAEKRMHQTTQQSSELEKQLSATPFEQVSNDPTAQKAMEVATSAQTALSIMQWKQANSITPEQDEAMGKFITDNPDKGYLLKNGYLSLDDVRAMSGVDRPDTDAIKRQGGKESLEQLANKQRATAPKAGASASVKIEEDPIMEILRSND